MSSTCQNVKLDSEVNFEFVFGNLNKQKTALTAFKSVLRKREILLKLQEKSEDQMISSQTGKIVGLTNRGKQILSSADD